MASPPSRRLHARYQCRLPLKVPLPGARTPMDGVVLNIGMGGAFIRVAGTLKVTSMKLEISVGKSLLAIDAKLVRSAGADPKDRKYTFYGVEFESIERNEQRIRMVVDQIRQQATGGVSLPMGDYWKM